MVTTATQWLWSCGCVVLLAAGVARAGDDGLEEPPPRTWAEVGTRYQTECPAPFFRLEKPETLKLGADTFRVEGSDLVRQGGPWKGPLRLGVLGAVKEASPETRENVRKAAAEFGKRQVHYVVANGDISEGEFDLEDAFRMLAEEVKLPVLAFIGNSEGKGSFSRAYLKTAALHPHLVNMNWVRHVDLGGPHLVSLPGYHDPKYLHGRAGCRYTDAHLRDVGRLVDQVHRAGGTVVFLAHSPPRSAGKDAIDVATDVGNVGDPGMTELFKTSEVRFGLFSHILEAGGRATSDLARGTPVRWPMKGPVDRLYVNAGSVSATPWPMLDGTTSTGMAAVMTLDAGKASVEMVKLRK